MTTKSISIALRAIDQMSRPFQKVGNMSDRVSGKLRSMRKELKELERAQNGVAGSIGTTAARMEKLSKAISKIEKANKNYEKTMKRAAQISLVAGGVGSVGRGMLNLISNPLDQMRGVERSKGELASLGMTNIGAVVAEGRKISGQIAGMNTAAFLSAAYDIKSGIASLTDEGVAAMTSMAAKTARATKAEVGQMTSLFATGYGSFKESLYKNLSDEAFGEVFSAGLAASVKQFKTDGSKMQQAIQSMGSGLAAAGVPLEDQLTGLGMLQQKMEAGVAGTTLAALERTAAQAQERFAKMGVDVDTLDESGNLRNLPDLLEAMQQTFGDTYTSEVGAQIQQAFGSEEAVKFFKALWGQQEQFRKNSEMLAAAQRQGVAFTEAMARAIDNNMDARLQLATQRFSLISEYVGYSLVPALEQFIPVLEVAASFLGGFIERQPGFTAAVTGLIAVLGGVAVAVSPLLIGFAALSVAMSKLSLQSKISAAEMALSGGGGFLGKFGKIGKLGKLGKVGGIVGAAVGALSIGSTLLDSSTSGAEKAAQLSSDVGGIGGALAGSAAGAALGSVVPFIGTAIGGLIGGIAGGFGGEWLGSKIGKWFLPDGQTIKSVPALAAAGGTSTTTVNAPITIHAAPGMDERKIAEEVGKELDKRHAASRARQRGALYDMQGAYG